MTLLSNLYKIDDRTINFPQAKTNLLKLTKNYVESHNMQKMTKIDTQEMILKVKELEWSKKQVRLQNGEVLSS